MIGKGPASEQKVYEVITQEDENGDLLIPLPEPILKSLGWKEGDDIEFGFDDKGRLILKKK